LDTSSRSVAKDQLKSLGVQYLKSLNFPLVSPSRKPLRKLIKSNTFKSSEKMTDGVKQILSERKSSQRIQKIFEEMKNTDIIIEMEESTASTTRNTIDSLEPFLKDLDETDFFWLFEYICKLETYSFVIKQDFALFSLNYIQHFLDLSKLYFLNEIRLSKLYLNLNSFSTTKILNPSAISKILSTFQQIFQFSVNFIKF
jgi:hypothetical protein